MAYKIRVFHSVLKLTCLTFCLSISLLFLSCDKDVLEELETEWNHDNSKNESGESQNTYEGSVDGREFVDLGLSVKWAKCNLGATSPSDYGNYYAWAETIHKLSYWPNNYKFYNTNTGIYSAPTSSICGTKYDAATTNWGNKWRMPSQKEAQELIDRCTWEETYVDGIIGYKVTGLNGKSIFLPKAGSFTGNEKGAKAGIFLQIWTGTYAEHADLLYFRAYSLVVSIARKDVSGASVYDGISIRPVTTAESDSQSGGSGNNSGGGSNGSDEVEDFYETNFSSTEYTNKITVNFYFSENVSSATIKYGTTTSCSSSKTASISAKNASASITGLKPGTKYYFKCVAKSKSGQSCTTSTYPVMTNYN